MSSIPQDMTPVYKATSAKGTSAARWQRPIYVDHLPPCNAFMNRITIRGSIVGTRKDLAEAIDFASEGRVRAHIHKARLDDINQIFDDLEAGKVDGRMVITI